MASKQEIEAFLTGFKAKLGIWGIFYRDDRGKNTQTLIDLEITPAQRLDYIKKLEVVDYSEGPKEDTLHHGPNMWVFGKLIKGIEIYIKITMGVAGSKVVCISFHEAEHKMNYPFKK
jgi:hypothetical protein